MAENQKEEKTLEEAFSELDVLADKLDIHQVYLLILYTEINK